MPRIQSNTPVLDALDSIRDATDIKFVFATLTGSRARGIAHATSDIDVRFVYLERPVWYFSPRNRNADALAREQILKLGIDIPSNIDLVGWELTKFLGLIAASNVGALEMAGFSDETNYYNSTLGALARNLRHYPHRSDVMQFQYASQSYNTLERVALMNSRSTVAAHRLTRPKAILTALLYAMSADHCSRMAKHTNVPPPVTYAGLMETGLLETLELAECAAALRSRCLADSETVDSADFAPVFDYIISILARTSTPTSQPSEQLLAAVDAVSLMAAHTFTRRP